MSEPQPASSPTVQSIASSATAVTRRWRMLGHGLLLLCCILGGGFVGFAAKSGWLASLSHALPDQLTSAWPERAFIIVGSICLLLCLAAVFTRSLQALFVVTGSTQPNQKTFVAAHLAHYAEAEALGHIGAWSYIVEGKVFNCTEGFAQLTGFSRQLIVDPQLSIWPVYSQRIHDDDREQISQILARTFDTGEQETYIYRYHHPELGLRWFRGSCAGLLGANGQIIGTRGIIADVTEQHHSAEQLRFASLHDELTCLPNRKHLEQVLNEILKDFAFAPEPTGVFVLYIDLDRYKLINDTLGHEAGDAALRDVVSRLKSVLKQHDVLARVGGDEFIAVLKRAPYVEEAVATAHHMLQVLAPPVQVQDHDFSISASIGIAVASAQVQDATTLTRMADKAMYAVKASGKNAVQVYSPNMDSNRRQWLEIESELSKAIRQDALSMQFQPVALPGSTQWIGFEALLRWSHPTRGALSPQDFVELAERGPLIHELGLWVARYAVDFLVRVHQEGFKHMTASINVSVQQCLDARFIDRLCKILDSAQLPPQALKIEITESAVMARFEETLPKLHELLRLGIGLVVDDFGVGQSSLSRLRDLHATEVKIDRGFIAELGKDERNDAIVNAAIDLAHRLQMKVTCEGIERPDQLALCHRIGSDYVQGNLIATPLDADVFIARLHAMQNSPTPQDSTSSTSHLRRVQ